MTEYIEIYSQDGTDTGIRKEKHAPKKPGEYCRHALVLLKTSDSPPPGKGEGTYIVQQRSLKARYYAGKWDMTGGGVRAEEAPAEAGIREVKEELGIEIPPGDMRLCFTRRIDREDGTGMFLFVYGARVRVPEGGICFDPFEVNAVKTAPFAQFLADVMDHNDAAFGEELKKADRLL